MAKTENFGFNIVEEEQFSTEPKPLVDWQRNVTDNFKNLDTNAAKKSELEKYVLKDDSGWITASLKKDFKPYNDTDANIPRYRKVGQVVEIRGVLAPTSTIAASTDTVTAFTLPDGFRPSGTQRYYICQGSGRNVWLLTVYPDGDVGVARYGTTGTSDIPTSAWLPFNATFLIN